MSGIIKNIAIFLLVFASASLGNAQEKADSTMQAEIVEGDTLFIMELPEVKFFAPRVFKNRFEEFRYRRLVNNVKKVYPFARLAAIKFEEYGEMLEGINRESHKRQLMRQAERELLQQFEGDLRRLTFTQGLILIKLVDRETQHTSYEIVQEFRGNLTAAFWQSLGRIFGYNLRTEYDPHGEDELIEEIVQMIEAGML